MNGVTHAKLPWLLVQNIGKWKLTGSEWALVGHQNIAHTSIANEAQLVTRAVPEARTYPPLSLQQELYEDYTSRLDPRTNDTKEDVDFEFITLIVRLVGQKGIPMLCFDYELTITDPFYHTWVPPFGGLKLKYNFTLSLPLMGDLGQGRFNLGKTQILWGEVTWQNPIVPLEVVCTSLDTDLEFKWITDKSIQEHGYWEVYFSCYNSSPHLVYLDSLLFKSNQERNFTEVNLDRVLKPSSLIRHGIHMRGEQNNPPTFTVDWQHHVVVDSHDTVRRTFTVPLPTAPIISLKINAKNNFANGIAIDITNSGSTALIINCIRATGIPCGATIRIPKSNNIKFEYDPRDSVLIPNELRMKPQESIKFSVVLEFNDSVQEIDQIITFTPVVSNAHDDQLKIFETKPTSVAFSLTGYSSDHKLSKKQILPYLSEE